MWDKLDTELDRFEIKQEKEKNEMRLVNNFCKLLKYEHSTK